MMNTDKFTPSISFSSEDEDDCLTKKELEIISKGLEEIKQGKTIQIKDLNNIWESIL